MMGAVVLNWKRVDLGWTKGRMVGVVRHWNRKLWMPLPWKWGSEQLGPVADVPAPGRGH